MENNNLRLRRNKIIKERKTLFLFDVDATLTPPRQPIESDMIEFLKKLSQFYTIGAVGGSDIDKLRHQLAYELFEYVFTENGLVSFKKGEQQPFHEKKINEYLGEEKLKKFLKFCLRYIADLEIPVQRGNFIEYRTGMINVSPIGRNCNTKERKEFEIYNKENKILEKFVETVEKEFGEFNMKFSIGGQISFDCFPVGWDKTYCLQFLDEYENIFFFGDKTHKGGNDYEIALDNSISNSFTVTGPTDTINKVTDVISNKLENYKFGKK